METSHKIAIFLPGLAGGGAERTMLNLAQAIADLGYPVDLVLGRREGPLVAEIPCNVTTINLNSGRTLNAATKLARYIRAASPSAMLAAMSQANLVAIVAKKLARTPMRLVVCEQNTLSIHAPSSPNRLLRFAPKFARLMYGWADCVVGVSQGVVDDLVEKVGLSKETTKVIHNAVITGRVKALRQQRADHPWFELVGQPVILAVGRLSEQKDYATLIRAFKIVRETRPTRLLILGEGEKRNELETLTKDLGLEEFVSMPGFKDNPYPYMLRASVFVLSSLWEGLPTVLIEAMYCGVPVVATDCTSGPREILADGTLGALVPKRDPAHLAAAILDVLNGVTAKVPPDFWHPYSPGRVAQQYIEFLLPR